MNRLGSGTIAPPPLTTCLLQVEGGALTTLSAPQVISAQVISVRPRQLIGFPNNLGSQTTASTRDGAVVAPMICPTVVLAIGWICTKVRLVHRVPLAACPISWAVMIADLLPRGPMPHPTRQEVRVPSPCDTRERLRRSALRTVMNPTTATGRRQLVRL